MKINWKVRLCNPIFWAEVAAAVVLPILAQLGLSWEDMDTWAALWGALTAAVESPPERLPTSMTKGAVVISKRYTDRSQREHPAGTVRREVGAGHPRTCRGRPRHGAGREKGGIDV